MILRALKIGALLISIPLSLVILVGALGYMAVRWDFWPPQCGVLPIPQARRVCEFSKRDAAPEGKSAQYTFWVTVPSPLPVSGVQLVIEGGEPIAMKKDGGSGWRVVRELTTGQEIRYHYSAGRSVSDTRTLRITRVEREVYDAVTAWQGSTRSALSGALRPEVNMSDTWTINYNFNFFEDTRYEIADAFERVAQAGAKVVGITTFAELVGTRDAPIVRPIASQWKYMRDKAMSVSEMRQVAAQAHERGMAVVLHYNMQADYSTFFFKGFLNGAGSGATNYEAEAGKRIGREEKKSKEYLTQYFDQLESMLVAWARDAQSAGIDGIDITPRYRPPTLEGQEAYADERFTHIIMAVRGVFQGRVYVSDIGGFGGFSGDYIPDFIAAADGLYVMLLPGIHVSEGASLETMRAAFGAELDRLNARYPRLRGERIADAMLSSYRGMNSGTPLPEFYDYRDIEQAAYERDWVGQADAYEALLQAVGARPAWSGVQSVGYWWDDLMAPRDMSPRNDLAPSIREKPAEAVWKKWFGDQR